MRIAVSGADQVEGNTQAVKAGLALASITPQSVGSSVKQAVFIEYGTRAHEIHPRAAKALSWPGARHPVKRVMHPGTRATHFLQEQGEAQAGLIAALVGAGIDQAASTGDHTIILAMFRRGVNEAVRNIQAAAPRRTGEYARSIHRSERGGD